MTITSVFKHYHQTGKRCLIYKPITSPSKFRIAYYIIATYNDNSKIIDITGLIEVPPAQFSLSSSPNPVILIKGETMDIGLQLMSNTGVLPNFLNFTPEHKVLDICTI